MSDSVNRAPYFDESQHAWVLSRYADVSAAMRDPVLFLAGRRADKPETPPEPTEHKAMRDETREALAATNLETWRTQLQPLAKRLADEIDMQHPVDLLSDYGHPICLAAASLITEVSPEDAVRLRAQTEALSDAAADPNPELRAASKAAQAEVAGCFHARIEQLRAPGFVALAHTMPRLLGSMWLALLEHPTQWPQLHAEPALTPLAVEELLRYAGLTTILYRRAAADTTINGVAIRKGEHLVLELSAANHDPEQFERADELDFERREFGHLSLGAGQHSCVGAPLIRMLAVLCTRTLVERFSGATLTEPAELKGGAGFRFPAALRVQFGKD